MKIKSKKGQEQVAKGLGYSSFTLQRYRHDEKMQSLNETNGLKKNRKTSKDDS